MIVPPYAWWACFIKLLLFGLGRQTVAELLAEYNDWVARLVAALNHDCDSVDPRDGNGKDSSNNNGKGKFGQSKATSDSVDSSSSRIGSFVVLEGDADAGTVTVAFNLLPSATELAMSDSAAAQQHLLATASSFLTLLTTQTANSTLAADLGVSKIGSLGGPPTIIPACEDGHFPARAGDACTTNTANDESTAPILATWVIILIAVAGALLLAATGVFAYYRRLAKNAAAGGKTVDIDQHTGDIMPRSEHDNQSPARPSSAVLKSIAPDFILPEAAAAAQPGEVVPLETSNAVDTVEEFHPEQRPSISQAGPAFAASSADVSPADLISPRSRAASESMPLPKRRLSAKGDDLTPISRLNQARTIGVRSPLAITRPSGLVRSSVSTSEASTPRTPGRTVIITPGSPLVRPGSFISQPGTPHLLQPGSPVVRPAITGVNLTRAGMIAAPLRETQQ